MNNNAGMTINFSGQEINVNSLDNKGDINIQQKAEITTVNNSITGNGNLNILQGSSLLFSPNINNVENTLNFNNATFDMLNGEEGI